jgi:Uma2 family endonuclease
MFERTLKETLLELPDVPALPEELHTALDDEQRRRIHFREWLSEDIKAEFIYGKIVIHSPVAHEHNEANGQLYRALSIFVDINGKGKVLIEKALVGMTRNDYEPDLAFWGSEKADKFGPKMNVYPIPDLIVEILSPGSENIKRDTKIKFDDYAAHQVKEYWIIDPDKKTIAQYLLNEETGRSYDLNKKVGIGDHIESMVIQGFKIPVLAVFDARANAEVLAGMMANAPQ